MLFESGKGKKPWILGMASSHNGGACLLHGDEIAVAIQEERLCREKRAEHPGAVGNLAIRYCLDAAGISPSDLNAVVLCVAHSNRGRLEDVALNPILQTCRNKIPHFTISHHLGHAIATYATSGFDNASILVVDGNGSPWQELSPEEKSAVTDRDLVDSQTDLKQPYREIISIYDGQGDKITPIRKFVATYDSLEVRHCGMPLFASLGDMYGFVGQQIFGSFSEGPGKVMGLAPYGRATIPVSEFFEVVDDGFHFKTNVPDQFTHNKRWPDCEQEYKDLAASAQAAIEFALIHLGNLIRREGRSDQLCYAGGVALNSVANEKLIRQLNFDQHFIMPAAEDSGTAIGACYWGLHKLTGRLRSRVRQTKDSVGRTYTRAAIIEAAKSIPGLQTHAMSNVARETAEQLSKGKILGWFQGGSELGPRALGFRSILCDARSQTAKEQLNAQVKFREGFRPFAPVILGEELHNWFVDPLPNDESPFMLRVMKFRESQAERVPAVVHVDGTGRVQTLSSDDTSLLRRLIEEYKDITGIPILLNTSFNIAGEPIVETPADALCCLAFSGLDGCVLEDIYIAKQPNFELDGLVPRISATRLSLMMDVKNDQVILKISPQQIGSRSVIHSYAAERMGAHLVLSTIPTDHVSVLDESSTRLDRQHLRVVTQLPWGEVVHACSADMLTLLMLIDGKRTLSEVYALAKDQMAELAYRSFMNAIAALARVKAINFNTHASSK